MKKRKKTGKKFKHEESVNEETEREGARIKRLAKVEWDAAMGLEAKLKIWAELKDKIHKTTK